MSGEAQYTNPDFLYLHSIVLQQVVAQSKKSGWVYCEVDRTPDGKPVAYSPKELDILDTAGIKEIPLSVHHVKKIFGGNIVEITKNV